ncbi:hypothetical protein ACFY0P_12930 [Streptomyces sp. NPDC001714]|uniref:hypothetical protein n=1 Tax=Streptomyces sp. NPDC001714 TaxID=3364603 RepID=UPI003681627A
MSIGYRVPCTHNLTGADSDTSLATGTDVLRLDTDGRISSVTVFLDRAPEGFDPAAHDWAVVCRRVRTGTALRLAP